MADNIGFILTFVFFRNSSALENATWLIYLSTSSAVIPMPLSEMVMVFFSLSSLTINIQIRPFLL